jgi:phage-related protein
VVGIARIIATAGVRLHVDGKGLALEIRQVIRQAMVEAAGGQLDLPSPTKKMADDAERDSKRLELSLGDIGSALLGVASRAASVALSGAKILSIGIAAVGALAGITQLTIGVVALAGAALQAAGVLGLIPAALAAIQVVSGAIKLGLTGMSDAFEAIFSGDAAAFDEATKNMAASARDFARAVRDLKPAFDQIRLDTQQALFEGLARVVQPLAETYLPLAGNAFRGIAQSANQAAREVAVFLLQGQQVDSVRNFLDNVNVSFGNLANAARPAVSAILDIVSVGSNEFPRMTAAVNEWANAFASRIRTAAETGALEDFFNRSIAAVQQLGRIFGNVFEAIGNIMNAASSVGGGFLSTIEGITEKFAEFTGGVEGFTAFQSFFASMQRVVDALGPAFFELLSIIGTGLLPILADLASIIGPILLPIFQAFGRLLDALRPVFIAVANAVATAMEALVPFFDTLGEAIEGAMPVLGPMIQDIGEAFGRLFEAMIPLGPLFIELLEAILPIIPPLIDMVVELMPRFIEIIEALIPFIREWIELWIQILPMLTDVVGFLLDVFIPVFEALMWVFTKVLEVITWAMTGIGDVITTVFTAIGEFLSSFWDGITGLFDSETTGIEDMVGGWLSNLWNGVRDGMANLASSIGGGLGGITKNFRDWINGILDAIGNWAGDMFQAGVNMIKGLLNGLRSVAGQVLQWFKDLAGKAVKAVTDSLGIFSPSRVFADIGRNIGAGLIVGLRDVGPAVSTAAADVAQEVISAAELAQGAISSIDLTGPGAGVSISSPAVGGEQPAAANQVAPVFQQTNVMRPGTDVQQFATTVMQRGYGDVLSGASTLGVRRNPVQAGVDDQWVGL